jgi:hypothetical protein
MGVFAFTVDCLRYRRLVLSPTRLVGHTTIVGHLHLYQPPLPLPTGVIAFTVGLRYHR